MSLNYTITDQEYRLLALVADKEEVKRAPDVYMSLYPSTWHVPYPTMTLRQVNQFMTSRLAAGIPSTASGRYQFMQYTLFGKKPDGIRMTNLEFRRRFDPWDNASSFIPGMIQELNLPPTLIFNRVLQDYLALQLLIRRQLRRWQSGSLTWNARGASTNDPDQAFMVRLAQEWAALPVPFAMRGNNRQVRAGETYYAGDRLNRSGWNHDTFYREIRALRLQGPGQSYTLDLTTGSAPHPVTGYTPIAQAQIAAGGGQAYHGGSATEARSTFTGAPIADGLPPVGNPYEWNAIDLLDNRYDFRTGRMVRDMMYNGVAPVAASAFQPNNGRSPVPDIGDDPAGIENIAGAVNPLNDFSDAERLAGLGAPSSGRTPQTLPTGSTGTGPSIGPGSA
jgi:muramidase (phage lysozyme)